MGRGTTGLLLRRRPTKRLQQGDHRGEQGDDDKADDDAQNDDHDRFENADQGADQHVDVAVIVVRDLDEHLVQVAGFFADVDHVDDDRVADLAGAKGIGEGFTLANGIVDFAESFGEDFVAAGFFGDVDGVENRHAGADQGAQGAGEAGDGSFSEDATHDGDLELGGIHGIPATLAHLGELNQRAPHKREGDNIRPPITRAKPIAHGEKQFCDAGEFGSEVFENVFELGDDDDHDHRHDTHGDRDDDDRVDHRADDLFLQLSGLFHEVGKPIQDQIEHTAGLTGSDHVDIQFVERLGILAHRIGQRATPFDLIDDTADDGFEQAGLLLIFQNLQRSENRQTGILQRRKLAGERDQLLPRHATDRKRHLASGTGGDLLGLLLLAGFFLASLLADFRGKKPLPRILAMASAESAASIMSLTS